MKALLLLPLLVLAVTSYAEPGSRAEEKGLAAADTLVVHEWGTFTCLQDENGDGLKGINSDEAPLPSFTHTIAPHDIPPFRGKSGTNLLRPDITMRLETPVIYFHLPSRATEPMTLDVNVSFKGGWLTEYFPDAQADPVFQGQPLTAESLGRLSWLRLRVGTVGEGPRTEARVWTAPRAVRAANVTATGGESERYLFYRGIGHLDAPVRVHRIGSELILTNQLDPGVAKDLNVERAWFLDARPDGKVAFRKLDRMMITTGNSYAAARTSAEFAESDFAAENLARLRAQMHAGIVADGLFADEGEALLNTWEASYFGNPGQRIFFLVPRAWTDVVLPLTITQPCDVHRTMIARIELVTPQHREALAAMAALPPPSAPLRTMGNLATTPVSNDPMAKAFYSLGRFRNALVRDAERRSHAPSLTAFVRVNRLQMVEKFRRGERLE